MKRDLKLKYRRSFLGYFWSLLNPLMMMSVMMVVFSYMFRFDIENYPLYLICGQTLFNCFNESTNKAMYAILDNSSLLKKVYVPKCVFPLARVLSNFATTALSLLAVLIVMIFTRVRFHFSMLLFPVPLVFLLFFASGVGMILSGLAVKFQDITHLYSVFTMILMYATPIFYPVSALPANVARIIKLNPIYTIIYLFRELLLSGHIPSAVNWLYAAGASLLMFMIGALAFDRMRDNFIFYI
ncbi:MAG: ABC transporter permease [Clostridia bacterium]|nr:ABC transporter permease [Clostridia bacterium]